MRLFNTELFHTKKLSISHIPYESRRLLAFNHQDWYKGINTLLLNSV